MPPQTLPSQLLIGGVSRQPQIARSRDHVQDMQNCIVDPAQTTIKRAGTRYHPGEGSLNELMFPDPSVTDFFYHWVNRSASEKFVMVVSDTPTTGNKVFGFIITGANIGDAFNIALQATGGIDFEDYIGLGTSGADVKLRAWTTADRTWLINVEAAPALMGAARTYYFDGIASGAGRTPIRTHNPDIVLDFGAIGSKDHRVPQFSDIIKAMPNGMNDTNIGEFFWTDFDEVDKTAGVYEVISVTTQPWFRAAQTEGVLSEVDQDLAPYVLNSLGPTSGVLTFESWASRTSGDSDTNPGPSLWTNNIPISAITFYQNRLWMGGRDTLVTSQTGAAENLWRKHQLLAIASDPIDQLLTGPQVNNITRIHPLTTGALLVLTDGGQQYEIRSSSGSFTAASTSVVATTSFPSVDIQPVNLGDRSYFLAEGALSSKLYEYYIFDQDRAALVTDVSTAIPKYLPKNIKVMAASESQEVILFQSPDEPNLIYLCQQKFSDGQRQLAAWHRWLFDPTADIRSVAVFDTTVYLVMRYLDGNGSGYRHYLETMEVGPPPDDTGMGDSVRLDRRVDGVQGVYDAATNLTSWTLPYRDATINTVVLDASWGVSQQPNTTVVVTNTTVGTFTVMTANGNYSEGTAYVGRAFDQRVRLSEPHITDENGRSLEGSLNLLRMTINHEQTVAYRVEVTAQGRDLVYHQYKSATLGGLGTLLGNPVRETGDFTVPIMAESQDTVIELTNGTVNNATWANIQFRVNFNPKRIGRV